MGSLGVAIDTAQQLDATLAVAEHVANLLLRRIRLLCAMESSTRSVKTASKQIFRAEYGQRTVRASLTMALSVQKPVIGAMYKQEDTSKSPSDATPPRGPNESSVKMLSGHQNSQVCPPQLLTLSQLVNCRLDFC
jgi:hypothetical protein